ncbi:MAG: hypothetical protein U0U70_17325 [Chitinophagaceae bacterium]
MKIIPAALTLLLFIASCQKEIDWGTGGTVISGQRLVMIKSKTGTTDTTQVEYFYDAAGRLVREKTAGVAGGMSLDNDLVIKRNGAGIITVTVQKSPALVAAGIDSVETRYNYNTGTSRYTSSVFALSIMGFSVTDSAVYTYDGAGKITKDEHYLQSAGLPIPLPPVLSARNIYDYSSDGKNLLSVSTEAAIPPSTTLSPATSQTYTMDTKVSPLIILNEAVLLIRPGLFSANNAIKAAVTNTADPSQDFTMDYVIKYNSSNKPDSSYGTRSPGGAVTATKYYYQ